MTTGGNCTAQGPCVYEDVEATLKAGGPHAVGICAGFKYHQGAGAGSIGYIPEQSPTLTADWHNPAVFCMADDNAKAAVDEDMCGTLKVGGGRSDSGDGRTGWVPETVGALCAVDYKGVSNQLVSAGKVICE